jgi:glucan phosphoethanolaminetransferase (alkaline phosphatase superfamily)
MNLSDLVWIIIGYLNQALFLLMGVATVMFVFYVIKYFMTPDADRTEARNYVLYSVIGFFIILSFWGLVNILQNTFGLQNTRNRPSTWASFSNLFPTGSSGSNSNQPYYMYENGTMRQVNPGNQQPFFRFNVEVR